MRDPLVLTQDMHVRLLPDVAEQASGETYLHRLAEVLSLAYEALQAGSLNHTRTPFYVFLNEREPSGAWKTSRLELWCCRQGKGYVIGWPEDFCE